MATEEQSDTNGNEKKRCGQFSPFVLLLSFIAGLGGFLFGYDTGVISGAILFIETDFNLTENWETELIVSGTVAGAVVGSLLAGSLNNWIGRKKCVMIACVVFALGAFVMAFAPDFYVLLIGRVIAGLGVGVASMTVPMYISECAPEESRGAMVSLDVLLITTGQFVAYCVDAACVNLPYNWRWMLGLSAVPAIIQFIGMIWMPESPRWLIEKQKTEKALEILEKTRPTKEKAANEAAEIQTAIDEEKILLGTNNRYLEILNVPALRHALVIGVMLQVFQQFTGINTVMYYSPTILQMSQSSSNSSYTESSDLTYSEQVESIEQAIYSSIVVAATNAIMSFIAVFGIDRCGRKILLLGSLIGVAGSLCILAYAFYGNAPSYVALIGLVSYLVFFAPGMGPVPWTINAEIYPQYVRSGATSIATCANWVSNLIVSLTFLTLLDLITPSGTFLLYAFIAVIAFVFVLFIVPETKSMSLESIQQLFERGWIVNPLQMFCKSPDQTPETVAVKATI